MGKEFMSISESTMMTNGTASVAVAKGLAVKTINLKPVELTLQNWKPYHQIVGPIDDGKESDLSDA